MNGTMPVDPVILTCAVRYALGRLSYMPGVVSDNVRACWTHLGDQQDVIRSDIEDWLTSSVGQPAPWNASRDVWVELLDWIEAAG